jgi:hypothetical protein
MEGLDFQSDRFESIEIVGASVRYTGEGTINADGRYSFQLTTSDGEAAGGDGIDRLRLKIWDQSSDEIVYDSQPDAGDDPAAAAPLGEGNIVIRR